MKQIISYSIVVFLIFTCVYGCTEKIDVDFSYSPEHPRIGESVTFTNLSSAGDDFDWKFRNITINTVRSSIAKNPAIIFTTPGVYHITLRADSNKNFVRTKELIIYDSIPTISRSVEEVNYYETVTFSPLAYNPFSRDLTYQWLFSENAHGESLRDTTVTVKGNPTNNFRVSYEEKPVVYFSQKEIEEIVYLRMTIGDSIYDFTRSKSDTFTVNDIKTRSLVIAQKNGKIQRQRLFENGVEDPVSTGFDAGKNPLHLISEGNQLYIFDAGSNVPDNYNENNNSGDGSIRVVDFSDNRIATIIDNNGKDIYSGFYSGIVYGNYLYWTDYKNFVYRIGKSERNLQVDEQGVNSAYYVANPVNFGAAQNSYTGGIYSYDDRFFWAASKGLSGIYIVPQGEINNKNVDGYDSKILTDYEISSFAVDTVFSQIYFSATAPSDKVGFWVANFPGGTNARRIDNYPMDNAQTYITGIVVDNKGQKVYWADQSGIKQMKLAKNNTITEFLNFEYLNEGITNIYGMTLDKVER